GCRGQAVGDLRPAQGPRRDGRPVPASGRRRAAASAARPRRRRAWPGRRVARSDPGPGVEAGAAAHQAADQGGQHPPARRRGGVLRVPGAVPGADRGRHRLRAGGRPGAGRGADRHDQRDPAAGRRLADRHAAARHRHQQLGRPRVGSAGQPGGCAVQRERRRPEPHQGREHRLRRGGDPRLPQAARAGPAADPGRGRLRRGRRRAHRRAAGRPRVGGARRRGDVRRPGGPVARSGRLRPAGARDRLPLRARPRQPQVPLGRPRQLRGHRPVGARVARVLALRQQLRQLRQDVRRAGRRRRAPALDVAHVPDRPGRGRDQQRDRDADGQGHDGGSGEADGRARRGQGRQRRQRL
ncbi:MAG: Ribonuclease BN, partial [uncultured Frankineae bacterium]